MNTTENNKLIAEFMLLEKNDLSCKHSELIGYKKDENDIFRLPSQLKYHSDWNWLMGVVERIEFLDNGKFDVNLLKNGTQIFEYQAGGKVIIDNVGEISFDNKIEHVYQAVVEFIKWYNNQTN